jgi:hypothetical protein
MTKETTLFTTLILLSLLFLSGCANVVSEHPIGTENYVASAKSWDGIWLSEGGFVNIKVMDQAKGIIKLAWIETKPDDFKYETVTGQIKQGKNGLYLNVKAKPDDELTGFYYWGKLIKNPQTIVFWTPSVKAFRDASDAGMIKAVIEKTKPDKSGKQRIQNIKLVDNPNVVLDLVEGIDGNYFELEDPIILMKVR